MINIPTTDIVKLITGEVDMPANIELGESTDNSFLSFIADNDIGADTPTEKLDALLGPEILRNDPTADPAFVKALFSPVLNVSEPALSPRDARFSDLNRNPSLTTPPNTKGVHSGDLTVEPMITTVAYGNESIIGYTSPVPSIDTKGRVPAQLKSITDTHTKNPAVTVNQPAPLHINSLSQSQPATPLPMMPAGRALDLGAPVDISKINEPSPVRPNSHPPEPMADQLERDLIDPPGDGQLQPPATRAGETVTLHKGMPVSARGTGLIPPQMPTADQPVNRNDFILPARASSTWEKTFALQSDIVSSRPTPFPRQQNLQDGTEKTGAQIGQFNMNLQKEPEISTKPAMLARPQSAVQDIPVQTNQTQSQHIDATSLQQSPPLQAAIKPIVLSPQSPQRQMPENQNIQPNPQPITGVETRMQGQNDNAYNVQPTQAATLVPAVDATPIETVDPVSIPDAIPLETRGADITTLTRIDTPLSRPEIMRHVAQQLADVARQMPDRPVELALNPEELGRVRLTFTTTDAGLHVAVIAERGETMDLLRRHIESLAQDFRDLGYRDVKFDFSGNGARSDAKTSSNENADQDQNANPDAAPQDIDAPIQLSLEPSAGLDLRL